MNSFGSTTWPRSSSNVSSASRSTILAGASPTESIGKRTNASAGLGTRVCSIFVYEGGLPLEQAQACDSVALGDKLGSGGVDAAAAEVIDVETLHNADLTVRARYGE